MLLYWPVVCARYGRYDSPKSPLGGEDQSGCAGPLVSVKLGGITYRPDCVTLGDEESGESVQSGSCAERRAFFRCFASST